MRKLLLACLLVFVLAGCGHTLMDEAHLQAHEAFKAGDYVRGSLFLAAGCDALHLQSIYLLRMIHCEASQNLLGMMVLWSNVRSVEASYDFVELAVSEFIHDFLLEQVEASEWEHTVHVSD
ncbi:MAG: hypothetical protein FWE07_07325 [Turicibacter sp.]|nr:hypothetical protein [Turicibacter sp.]